MAIALWIIAICEVIRIAQNSIQLITLVQNNKDKYMKTATDAFVESLNVTDKEFIADILNKIEESGE